MSKLLVLGGFVFLSLFTFFDTARGSLDIRSKGQEGVQTESLLKEDLPDNLSIKTVTGLTYLSFDTAAKYISMVKLGDNPKTQDINYIINPDPGTNHQIRLKGLEKDKTYFFQIQLIDNNGISNFSKVYNFKTNR